MLVALTVGVAPLVHSVRNGRARAKTVGRIFLAEVDLATFWIVVGFQIAKHGPHEAQHYNAAIGFALNCRRVDTAPILSEIEHVPQEVGDAIAEFGQRSIEFVRTVCGVDGNPLLAPDDFRKVPTGWQEIMPVYNAANALRSKLHSWLSADQPANVEELAERTSDRIRAVFVGGDADEG